MSPVSLLPILPVLGLAALTAWVISRFSGASMRAGHLVPVDGLRGYLAVFVMLHHASIWFFYLRTGNWAVPPSTVYTHLGQGSVAFFFMITAFLFFSKLLDAQGGRFDFSRLYVSRLLRLTPLYFFAMALLLVVVAIQSGGELRESWFVLAKHVLFWLGFTMHGAPDINRVGHTSLIIAAVTWSLRYEWLFYCVLPLLGLLLRIRTHVVYLLLGGASVVAMLKMPANPYNLAAFGGGMLAAVIVRGGWLQAFAASRTASWLVLALVSLAVLAAPTSYATVPLLLLTAGFILVASGNSLFGLLSHPASLVLGSMAYSIYLLHGICLYVLFNLLLDPQRAGALSPEQHWTLVIAMVPCVLIVAFASHCWVERPGMRHTDAVLAYLRRRLAGLPWRRRVAVATD